MKAKTYRVVLEITMAHLDPHSTPDQWKWDVILDTDNVNESVSLIEVTQVPLNPNHLK